MTTTKTYRVSDGYGIKTFTDRDEAIAYALDVFQGFRADGMTRVEAAEAIEVKTTVVEVENMAEFMGGETFMSELEQSDEREAAEQPKVEPKRVENELTADSGDPEWLDKLCECWSEVTTKHFNVETMQYEDKTRWHFMGYYNMPEAAPVKETAKFAYYGEKGDRTKYRKPTK